MKNIVAIFFFSLLFCSEISADITSQLLKLNEMYKSGTITEEEFKKAKSILLKMDAVSYTHLTLPPTPYV